MAFFTKDYLIILVGYAKERNLLDQKGWKWAKKIENREKKLMRLLKLIKE